MNYFRYFLLVGLFLINIPAFSLTLGNAKVKSFVNQNLDAEIEVLSHGKIHVDKIKAFLAPKADFDKFDLERESFLDDIRFVTYQEESGKIYIHLTSSKLIREPLVSLIINLRTVEGNISREYNLFINPSPYIQVKSPGFSQPNSSKNEVTKNRPKINQDGSIIEESDKIVNTSDGNNSQSKRTKMDKFSIPGVYRPDLDYMQKNYNTSNSYPVKAGDLLTSIAQKIRPDDSYAVQKISKLLYQYNPEAFLNGNINQLKVGAILNFPELNQPEFRKDSLAYLDKGKDKNKVANNQTQQEDNYDKALAQTKNKLNDDEAEKNLLKKEQNFQQNTQLRLMSDNELVNNEKLQEQLESTDGSIGTDEFIDSSKNKLKILKDENKALSEQFNIIMIRMEELISKNSQLDAEISLLKSSVKATEVQKNEATYSTQTDSAQTDSTQTDSTQTDSAQTDSTIIEEVVKQTNPTKVTMPVAIDKSPSFDTSPTSNSKLIDTVKNKPDNLSWLSLFAFALLILLLLSISYVFIRRYRNKNVANEEFSLDHALDNDVAPIENKEPPDNKDPTDNDNKFVQVKASKESDPIEKNRSTEQTSRDIFATSDDKSDETIEFDLDLDESDSMIESIDITVPESQSQESEHPSEVVDQFNFGEEFDKTSEQTPEKQNNSVANASLAHSAKSSSGVNFNDILGPSKSSKSEGNVDLISQSSVYFAYGKFDLAEDLLSKGIEQNPEQNELKLKLFECYAKMDDESKFLAYLEQLKDLYNKDKGLNETVKKMYLKQWDKELF